MAINDFNRQDRRHKSSLTTDFDRKVEGQRLRDEPGRGNVESIQELRNRPDPETDAFLGQAAREAGFRGDVGFGQPGSSSSLGFGDKEMGGVAARDQSWGVNPRGSASSDNDFMRRARQAAGFAGGGAGNMMEETVSAVGPALAKGNKSQDGRGVAEQFGSRVGGALKGASDFATAPARAMAGAAEAGRSAVADFSRGVMNPQQPFTGVQTAEAGTPDNQRDSGFVPGGGAPATAFRGGQGHTGRSSADVSQFLTDDRSRERARNDPATGNPVQHTQAFGEDIYRQGNSFSNVTDQQGQPQFAGAGAMNSQQAAAAYGSPADFMQNATNQAMSDTPAQYTGGADETGAGGYGAPGSSGTPGPGGTVSTISAEAFTNPGGTAAGDAAVGRARRDFQLRQEGNAHLASDATPDEKIAAKRNEIQNELRTLNFGTDQSFSQLANNKARARQLQQEMARLDQKEQGIMAGETAAAERGFEAQENQLDRQTELKQTALENMPGMGELKIGGTHEGVLRKMVNNSKGYAGLSKPEQFIVEQDIRNDIVKNWDLSMGEMTKDNVDKRVEIAMGELKKQVDAASDGAEGAANNLAGMGLNDLPRKAQEALNQGKAIKYQGTTYAMGQDGKIQPVSQ